MKDKHGREWLKISELEGLHVIEADGETTCVAKSLHNVHMDDGGDYYILGNDDHLHYLFGHYVDGYVVGFYRPIASKEIAWRGDKLAAELFEQIKHESVEVCAITVIALVYRVCMASPLGAARTAKKVAEAIRSLLEQFSDGK